MKQPKIFVNLAFPNNVHKVKNKPIDGIGLLRLEFMIATYVGEHPAHLIEEGKREIYIKKIQKGISTIAKEIYPKPVIVRFSDFKTNEYRDLLGGTKYESKEENPMMGFRGASRFISEEFTKIFRAEIESMIRIREDLDNLWGMIPFIRTIEEGKKCLDILKEEGLQQSNTFKLFMMAETPSVALLIDDFNKLPFDGYSIGTNDLCQFILAVDRDNSKLLRMGYFNEENDAVIKAIELISKGAQKAHKSCSICGDCVSYSKTMLNQMIDLGINNFSVNLDAFDAVYNYLQKLFA